MCESVCVCVYVCVVFIRPCCFLVYGFSRVNVKCVVACSFECCNYVVQFVFDCLIAFLCFIMLFCCCCGCCCLLYAVLYMSAFIIGGCVFRLCLLSCVLVWVCACVGVGGVLCFMLCVVMFRVVVLC